MTDDELDRALFALPLEQPPAAMHQPILAATVLRAAPLPPTLSFMPTGRPIVHNR